MSFGRIRGSGYTENAEINMVPLIDVMLVLLVIFIITAPMVTQSVDLTLPKTAELPEKSTQIQQPQVIQITESGEITLNQNTVEMENLHLKLMELTKEASDELIIRLNIDENVPYDTVAKALIEIKRAGLSKIGFTTTIKE